MSGLPLPCGKLQTPGLSTLSETFSSYQYPVMEHFLTIQGEGFHSGKPAYFIRLAGCDVGCPWCDVKESWDEEAYASYQADEIVSWISSSSADIVVITGGEPLLHDLDKLTNTLRKSGKQVHIETSGSSPLSGEFDWITFSPKRYKAPLDDVYSMANELKVVIANTQDLRWAERQAQKCHSAGNTDVLLYLQPEWFTSDSNQLVVEYALKHPQWRISLQTHKYLNVP